MVTGYLSHQLAMHKHQKYQTTWHIRAQEPLQGSTPVRNNPAHHSVLNGVFLRFLAVITDLRLRVHTLDAYTSGLWWTLPSVARIAWAKDLTSISNTNYKINHHTKVEVYQWWRAPQVCLALLQWQIPDHAINSCISLHNIMLMFLLSIMSLELIDVNRHLTHNQCVCYRKDIPNKLVSLLTSWFEVTLTSLTLPWPPRDHHVPSSQGRGPNESKARVQTWQLSMAAMVGLGWAVKPWLPRGPWMKP